MRPEDYPPQEPFSAIGAVYHDTIMSMGVPEPALEEKFGSNPYQSLSVYPAEQPTGHTLCVIHGGGWTNGYKEWMAFMAPALNSRGITMVSLGYRLAPAHIYPQGLKDCMEGIASANARIAEFGGDPDMMFIGGHSAGGHYAALLALKQDWQAERSLQNNVVKGALPISGTYFFGPDSGLSMRPRFLGPEESGNDRSASPMNYVHPNSPPFLVAWGDKDFPHLVRQAHRFVERMRDAGNHVETLELAGCDHLGASYRAGDAEGEWVAAACDFMNRMIDNKES